MQLMSDDLTNSSHKSLIRVFFQRCLMRFHGAHACHPRVAPFYKMVSEVGCAWCCFFRALGVEGLEPPPLEKLNSSVSTIVSCANFIAPLAFRWTGLEYIPLGTSSLPWWVSKGEPVWPSCIITFRPNMGDLSTRLSRLRYVASLAPFASSLLLSSCL